MTYHVLISKPRRGTRGRYVVNELERRTDGVAVRISTISYADTNTEAKDLASNYTKFHFIESIVFANGKERKI